MLLLIPPPRATGGTASQTDENLLKRRGQSDGGASPLSVSLSRNQSNQLGTERRWGFAPVRRSVPQAIYFALAAMMASDTLRGASE